MSNTKPNPEQADDLYITGNGDKMEAFDVNDAFVAEAQPLWEQLHDLARKYNIPVVFAACTSNNEERYASTGCAHLPGAERTPLAFGLGAQFLHSGMEGGMEAVSKVAMLRVLGRLIVGDEDEDDDANGDEARPANATLQ